MLATLYACSTVSMLVLYIALCAAHARDAFRAGGAALGVRGGRPVRGVGPPLGGLLLPRPHGRHPRRGRGARAVAGGALPLPGDVAAVAGLDGVLCAADLAQRGAGRGVVLRRAGLRAVGKHQHRDGAERGCGGGRQPAAAEAAAGRRAPGAHRAAGDERAEVGPAVPFRALAELACGGGGAVAQEAIGMTHTRWFLLAASRHSRGNKGR